MIDYFFQDVVQPTLTQLSQCIQAATELRNGANYVGHEFIEWYERESVCGSG